MSSQSRELPPEDPDTIEGVLAALAVILENMPDSCSPKNLAQAESSKDDPS